MSRVAHFASFLIVPLMLTASAAFADAAPLAPTAPWVVDYAESQCIASRNYGTPEKPLYLVLKPSVAEGSTQLLVVQMGYSGPATQYRVNLDTGLEKPIQATALDYSLEKPHRRIRSMVLTAEQMRVLSEATRVDITARTVPSYHFELRQMKAIQRKLGECLVDLFAHWQISPEQQASVVRQASANLMGIFSDTDYPAQAVSERNSGTVAVRLLIETSGKVADCSVLDTSGSAALDMQTCRLIRERANFKPALDKDGKPLRAFYNQKVTWQVP